MFDSDSDEDIDNHFNSSKPVREEESLLGCDQHEIKITAEAQCRGESQSKYPKIVFLILGTEFCERFNYYGMRTILVIYLTEWLGLAYHSAVALFHLFSMLAYFSPLLGAIIADGYLGRFRTIFYVSIVYAVGTLIIALTALPPPEIYGPVIGLLLVSLGTGGIKPCVTALGGDQFSSHQEKERMAFFSAFYFIINLGSMLATLLTPVLRADVHCIGNSCYPLAFGLSTILMFLAIVIFASGKKHYKHVPPTGNLFGRVIKCVWIGMKMRVKQGKHPSKDKHWLNYAEGKYEEHFIEDVKALLKVLWLFIPLPLFWALFDQQGSRWTLQAVELNGSIGSLGHIKPDQLQVINPILILLLIPLFERLVYPCLNKAKIPNRPLQRMCAGMVLCCVAFIVAGFVQLKMDGKYNRQHEQSGIVENHMSVGKATYDDDDCITKMKFIKSVREPPLQDESGLVFINSVNCSIHVQSAFYKNSIPAFKASPLVRTSTGNNTMSFVCGEWKNRNSSLVEVTFNLRRNEAYRLVIHDDGGNMEKLFISLYPDTRSKDTGGKAKISIVSFLPSLYNSTVWIKPYENNKPQDKGSSTVLLYQNKASNFSTLEPGKYQLLYDSSGSQAFNSTTPVEPVLSFAGVSVQTVVLVQEQASDSLHSQISALHFITLKENELSIALLVPQFFVITVGEVLFSITGLAFAYSQAPSSMKSVLQAAWHLCVAVGDLIVVIVAETQLMPTQSAEFFMFATIMGLDTILFILMAYRYKSRALTNDSEVEIDMTSLINADK